MSYTIQVNSKVLFLPPGSINERGYERYADDLFWFVKIGSNNISPFMPDWTFQKSGESYSVVGEVCRQAGYCEGGSVKYGTHPNTARDLSPEEYLADYREKARDKQMLTLTALKSVRHSVVGFGNFKKAILNAPDSCPAVRNLNDYQQETVLKGIGILNSEYEKAESCWANDETWKFRRKVERVEDFLQWIKLKEDLKPLGVWAIHG